MPSLARLSAMNGSRLIIPALLAALGVSLLLLAVPRTIASWVALPADPAIRGVFFGEHPPRPDLVKGIDSLKKSLAWLPTGDRLLTLGALEFELAISLPASSQAASEAAARAETYIVEGLTLAPADSVGWLRLALVGNFLRRPPDLIAASLVRSFLAGSNLRPAWPVRSRMLMIYWSSLPPDDKLMVRQEFRNIWTEMPAWRSQLVKDAIEVGRLTLLQWTLGDDPAVQTEFEKMRGAALMGTPQ